MSFIANRINIHRSRMKLFFEIVGILGVVILIAAAAMSLPSIVRYIKISRM